MNEWMNELMMARQSAWPTWGLFEVRLMNLRPVNEWWMGECLTDLWSADQLTFMMWAGYTSPLLLYLDITILVHFSITVVSR